MELRTLNACPACGRQYDVSFLAAGQRVRCECGERFPVEFRAAHSPRALRCSSCGANLQADAKSCAYCQAEVALEDRGVSAICPACWSRLASRAQYCMECGLAIAPQALQALPETSACPRCRGALRQRRLSDYTVVECAGCGGLWLAPDLLDGLCERADQEELAARALSGPPGTRAILEANKVAYLPCPLCADLMTRKNFASSSGVILDVCRHHGVWLDHGEIEKVLSFVRAGGLQKSRERTLERLKEEERRVKASIESERGLLRGLDFHGDRERSVDIFDALGWLGSALGKRGWR